MDRKQWAKTVGLLAVEFAVGNLVGTVAALGVALPLLLYAFRDQEQVKAQLPAAVLGRTGMRAAIAVAALAVGFDGWHAFVLPGREMAAKQEMISLAERDAESWPGHKYGSRFRLIDPVAPPLRMQVGEVRRFNPQLWLPASAEPVEEATVYLSFPKHLVVDVPQPWTVTDGPNGNLMNYYYAEFGNVASGVMKTPSQAAFYISTQVVGPFTISYRITGITRTQGLLPIGRSVSILVEPVGNAEATPTSSAIGVTTGSSGKWNPPFIVLTALLFLAAVVLTVAYIWSQRRIRSLTNERDLIKTERDLALQTLASKKRDYAIETLERFSNFTLRERQAPETAGKKPHVTVRYVSYGNDYDLAIKVRDLFTEHVRWEVKLDGSNNPSLPREGNFKVVVDVGDTMFLYNDLVVALNEGNLLGVEVGINRLNDRKDIEHLIVFIYPSADAHAKEDQHG